jgi:ketosteroid isomerase-like protein
MTRLLLSALAALFLAAAPASARDARAAVDALLAADRAFSAAAARAPGAADGIAAMLDAEAVMPLGPGRGHAVGRDAVVAALRERPGLSERRASWAPVRGGISADGTHGFTFGFLTLSGDDPARREHKYLAYWIRRPAGWRVVAYRQVPRGPGTVSTAALPPSLPGFAARPSRDAAAIAAHRAGLHAAEQAFSDRAQRIGLAAAFREYGRDDAMNMGMSAGFTIGAEAISRGVDSGEPVSPVRWRTERSFVASSGDLGVSIGTIHLNGPAAEGRPASFPFFTIWRRETRDGPWRYIAE